MQEGNAIIGSGVVKKGLGYFIVRVPVINLG